MGLSFFFVYSDECSVYVAPSIIDGVGRGVFAGKNFQPKEIVDTQLTITIPYNYVWEGDWSLKNYVFGHEEPDQCMAVLGIGMMFNHRERNKVSHHWEMKEVSHSQDNYWTPSSVSTLVNYDTVIPVEKGEEMYINYGGSHWFKDRGISLTDEKDIDEMRIIEPQVSAAYLQENGFCISDVYISESELPLAGHGLFAKRSFEKGEIVTITPLLALPSADIELMQHDSVLQNYCLSYPGSDIAMFPIGYAGVINHSPSPLLEYHWFDGWNNANSSLNNTLNMPITELLESDYSLLDLKYVATRAISAGEELTVDYGSRWTESWSKYLAELLVFKAAKSVDDIHSTKPLFRRFMDVPEGFFPDGWSGNEPDDVYLIETEIKDLQKQERVEKASIEIQRERARQRMREVQRSARDFHESHSRSEEL